MEKNIINASLLQVATAKKYAEVKELAQRGKSFRSSHADPSLLEDLIARNKCPVRPDRIAVRKTRCHSAIGFNYRLS